MTKKHSAFAWCHCYYVFVSFSLCIPFARCDSHKSRLCSTHPFHSHCRYTQTQPTMILATVQILCVFFCRLHMTNTREHKSSHRLKIDLQVLAGLLFSAKHIYAICCSTRHTAFVQSPLPSCLFPQSQVLEHPKSVFFINSSFRKMKLFTTWKSYFLHVRINILFLCKRSILFDCEWEKIIFVYFAQRALFPHDFQSTSILSLRRCYNIYF